ncbi:MAG: enoyl-CoA hydratase/isomerase family protein [Planctomycetes bacterium]|nr:enoyl-CoA hydratase/isomerase family protein [Planctomycetota bacterium]NOG53709.1 enoyl-CoA hydratase/isomerase family protein [Planctomycetota bacterium]
MSQYEYLTCETAGGIATITLNRPPLNVLHNPMMAELNNALEAVLGDETLIALVLRAEGKAFSAGVDVSDHTADKVEEMIRLFHGIFRKMLATDAVTIAAVQGAALGGGCELACFCDVVLASDRAKFGQPEVQVGVFPPVAACSFPRRMGLGKAIELVALGATIRADEALRIGLASQVFPLEEFDAKVSEYVAVVSKLSAPVVQMAKRATVAGARDEILAHLEEAERIYLKELMSLKDAHEGIAAFLEKRAPVWVHG